ncbi:CPLN1 protein, partial [Odontophorus gujanensis]|nr:CPLN1 protein [Odontophorus gujanensis]
HCRLTSKDIELLKKKKEEKDKVMLSEFHSMRVSQAFSLMNELLSETVMLPATEHRPLSRTGLPQECRKRHTVPAKGFCLFVCCCRGHPSSRGLSERSRTAARPCFGQKGYHYTPALGSAQSKGKNRPS